MRAVSAAFASAVTSSHRRALRVTALNPDLSARSDVDLAGAVVGGSVTISADRRRALELGLANPDGVWTPAGAGDPFFPNSILFVERGIYVGGAAEFVPLGVFLVDRPTISRNAASSPLSVRGQDRMKLALRSSFTSPTRFDQGQPLGELIAAIAQAAGMGSSLYRLNDDGRVLRADRAFEVGESRTDAIAQLAADYALEVFVDAVGYLVVQPAMTEASVPATSWRFEAGSEAVMLGLTKEWSDERLYNHVLVTGEASDLAPVRAEARDLNPASPAYNPPDGSGPIGDRLFTYSSAMIRDAQQAQDVADARLLEVALLEESISIPSVVMPALEVGDVIEVADPESATNDSYLLDSVTIPLAAGSMTMTSRKLRSLS